MNLAIEYLLRNKRVHAILTVPCTLFLHSPSGHKLVVGIHSTYISSKHLTIKHWNLSSATESYRLPPFTEFRVSREDVFTSEHTVLPGHTILDYDESPYEAGLRQVSEYPQGFQQQKVYEETLDNFYNTHSHQERRADWLWQAFESVYVPEHLRYEYGREDDGRDLQREIIQFYSKPIWNIWLHWRKHLLDFPGVASELVFRKDYVVKERKMNFWAT